MSSKIALSPASRPSLPHDTPPATGRVSVPKRNVHTHDATRQRDRSTMPQRRRCPVCHNYVDHYTDARLTQRIEGHTDKAGNDCPASHYEFTITLASTFTEAELAAQADIARRRANGEQPRRTARRRKGPP